MKAATSIVLKVIALTIILFVCFAVAGGVLLPQKASATPEQASAPGALLAVCFLNTLILTHLVLRSRWAGWRLIATVAFVFYGVTTFMPQIESAVFLTRLPPGTLPRLFLMGALVAAPFSVLAVLVLGRRRADPEGAADNPRLVMPPAEWAWKLAAIVLAYVAAYFTFGYFIVWRNPVAREYYGGIDEGTFFAQLGSVARSTPWLIPFQIMRGLLWAGIALPVIRMMRGGWPEAALAIGFLFGVMMPAWLLLPNPYMPDAVRMAHLIETSSSMLIFGFFVGWLLLQRRDAAQGPARDQHGAREGVGN
jgi:hypothetical protein